MLRRYSFGGKGTKTARWSQGKKIMSQLSRSTQGYWEIYRKAPSLETDKNKECNLAICLMHMNRMTEAKFLLQTIKASSEDG
ncbi:protein POLLENLESS 3-LIKE 2-like [Cornus florida]|uniref:protein POLLENLESS 3-LIKE 2-like n=1 Tax=Cornus florida TaxID=4283 RepID=UPI002899752D|nr:protein POLLENLESS 3-LIKE 2-like [Cornus florida]